MDIPASTGDGTGGSSSRPTTSHGTIKYDSKEVSNLLCEDDPGHDTYSSLVSANIGGSMTFMGSQLLTLDGTSREPGVLNTVRPEPSSSSVQSLGSSELIQSITDTLIQIVEEIKQFPELFAALSATNALVILQSFVAGSVGPDARAVSSRQLGLVNDNLMLIRQKYAEVASSSKLPHGADSGGVGLYRTDCSNVELNVYSLPSGEKDQFADSYNKEPNLTMGGETKERNDGSKFVNNEVDDKDGQRMETTDGDSCFKHALANLVKELLDPIYIRDQIDRDTYKKIVKKVVTKVTLSVPSTPQTQENIKKYLSTFKPNISKLVKDYIKIFVKEKANLA